MTDLADFLRARLLEIRQQAVAATTYASATWTTPFSATLDTGDDTINLGDREVAAHVILHDPGHVIADMDAKLALLDDLLAELHHVNDGDCWYTCAAATDERDGGETCDDNRHGKPCDCGRDERVQRRLRILAQPFAEHVEYKPNWTPNS